MNPKDTDPKSRPTSGLEENLKSPHRTAHPLPLRRGGSTTSGNSPLLEARNHGTLSIVFPYAAIYRITAAGYLTESEKKTAPDGRSRQYYAITPAGRAHLQEMLATYHQFFQGVNDILAGKEDP